VNLDLPALLADPPLAMNLSQSEAVAALAQVGALEAVLRARLAATMSSASATGDGADHCHDEMLTAEQAARRTGLSRRSLYARAAELPFAVRVGQRAVRFSARGVDRWLAKRKQQQQRTGL
jgi:predicted DNA-binding transcriptional regulator AlpA